MATTKKVASLAKTLSSKKDALVSKRKTVRSQKGAGKKVITPKKKSSETSKKVTVINRTKTKSSQKYKKQSSAVLTNANSTTISAIMPLKELAVLTPTRFPIDVQQLATKSARYGGIFFVAIGALFSLFFASTSFTTQSQIATAVVGDTQENALEEQKSTISIDCDDPLHYLSESCALSVNKKPEASFDISAASVLQGDVRIRVKVPHAQSVQLTAFHKTQKREVKIGVMNKVSNDTWEFYWKTALFDDGEYKVKALIKNGYGTYEAMHTVYHNIDNIPLQVNHEAELAEPAVPDTNASSSVTEQILTLPDTTGPVVLSASSQQDRENMTFDIAVDHADKVKIYAYHIATKKETLLGYAIKENDISWNYTWNTKSFAQGDYRVTALALHDGLTYTSNRVIVTKTTPLLTTEAPEIVNISDNPELTDDDLVQPSVKVVVSSPSPLRGTVGVKIDVEAALYVQVFALERYTLTRKFLGMAIAADDDTWTYQFDSTQVPNKEYKIVVTVKNAYGIYEGESTFFKVLNEREIVYAPTQEKEIKALTDVAQKIAQMKNSVAVEALEDESVNETTEEKLLRVKESLPEEVRRESPDTVETILMNFDKRIESELQKLAAALRVKDANRVQVTNDRLEGLKHEIIDAELGASKTETFIKYIDERLQKAIIRVEEDIKTTEKIITERTQQEASLDSDDDGIADYDEVVIYKTDPFTADSDNDGFIDGAEILNGYNPLDATPETLVVFESPKEAGIVREDILVVESVIRAQKNDTEEDVPAKAIISGKALPYSFITLYIFSTPTIVTIKTEADGSWNYRFDKELEDGEHEVYIGVTDNAGKIVAKSSPFTFVKTAEAFTPAVANTQENAPTAPEQTSFLSEYMVYLVLSISVVAIGLVLILLGLHLDARPRKFVTMPEQKETIL